MHKNSMMQSELILRVMNIYKNQFVFCILFNFYTLNMHIYYIGKKYNLL